MVVASRARRGRKSKRNRQAEAGIVSFEPFVANLADEGGTRFLRASLKLVVEGEERAKEVEENAVERAQLQSAILEVLTQQTADAPRHTRRQGRTEEGHPGSHRRRCFTKRQVTDVLFTEFVVQF